MEAGDNAIVLVGGRDVIVQLAAMAKDEPQSLAALVEFLQKELLAEQYAHVEEAGHPTGPRISLSSVFIDCPLTSLAFGRLVPDWPVLAFSDFERLRSNKAIAQLLRSVLLSYKPSERSAEQNTLSLGEESLLRSHRDPPARGVVLLGAPGQGKSTLGQAFCQLLRGVLLRSAREKGVTGFSAASTGLSGPTRKVLASLDDMSAREGLPAPPARLPFTVPLAQLAQELDQGQPPDKIVLTILARQVARRLTNEFTVSDLESWLRNLPSAVVFDGLDEVPVSANREATIDALRLFETHVTAQDLDTFIAVTSRPQGYAGEFDIDDYSHLELASLDPVDALRYGYRLVEERYGAGEEKTDRVIADLDAAARQPASARLLGTPLNVTILTALVSAGGAPPEEAWSLYRQYYNLVYSREVERGGFSSHLLEHYANDIYAIHAAVGLLLQRRAEISGGSLARLSRTDFLQLVAMRLEQEGQDEPGVAESIADTATDRLVFLVGSGREDLQLGFEHRTFQEFFAAEAVMDVGEEKLVDRLRDLALRPHWRSTLLFCIGRCFTDRPYLRKIIPALCADLNIDPDRPGSQYLLKGSELALDILLAGIVARQPAYARRLAQIAAQLLDTPRHHLHERLATVAGVARDEMLLRVEERIEHRCNRRSRGAWTTALMMGNAADEKAIELVRRYWPPDWRDQQAVLLKSQWAENDSLHPEMCSGPFATALLVRFLREWPVSTLSPLLEDSYVYLAEYRDSTMLRNQYPVADSDIELADSLKEYLSLRRTENRIETSIALPGPDGFSVNVNIRSFKAPQEIDLASFRHRCPEALAWAPLLSELDFLRSPGRHSLAAAVFAAAKLGESDGFTEDKWGYWVRMWSPWPLGQCLTYHRVRDTDELQALADAVSNGAVGDAVDWAAAEESWAAGHISFADLSWDNSYCWPTATRSCFPLWAARFKELQSREALALWRHMGDGTLRDALGELAARLLAKPRDQADDVVMAASELADVWTCAARRQRYFVASEGVECVDWSDSVPPHVAAKLASAAEMLAFRPSPEPVSPTASQALLRLLSEGEAATGLLNLVAALQEFPIGDISDECLTRGLRSDRVTLSRSAARICLLKGGGSRQERRKWLELVGKELDREDSARDLTEQILDRLGAEQAAVIVADLVGAVPMIVSSYVVEFLDEILAASTPPWEGDFHDD